MMMMKNAGLKAVGELTERLMIAVLAWSCNYLLIQLTKILSHHLSARQ